MGKGVAFAVVVALVLGGALRADAQKRNIQPTSDKILVDVYDSMVVCTKERQQLVEIFWKRNSGGKSYVVNIFDRETGKPVFCDPPK
jgi:hypothetical protein